MIIIKTPIILNDNNEAQFVLLLTEQFRASFANFDFFFKSKFIVGISVLSGTIGFHYSDPDPTSGLTFFCCFQSKSMTAVFNTTGPDSPEEIYYMETIPVQYSKLILKAIDNFIADRYPYSVIFLDLMRFESEEEARSNPLLVYP